MKMQITSKLIAAGFTYKNGQFVKGIIACRVDTVDWVVWDTTSVFGIFQHGNFTKKALKRLDKLLAIL